MNQSVSQVCAIKLRFSLRQTGVDSDFTQNFCVKIWWVEALLWINEFGPRIGVTPKEKKRYSCEWPSRPPPLLWFSPPLWPLVCQEIPKTLMSNHQPRLYGLLCVRKNAKTSKVQSLASTVNNNENPPLKPETKAMHIVPLTIHCRARLIVICVKFLVIFFRSYVLRSLF